MREHLRGASRHHQAYALDGEPGASTLWITEEAPRRVVKAESELAPEFGGGTAVTELVSIDT